MTDINLRTLERRALRGSDADKAAFLSAAVRTGIVPQLHIELAALLGHVPSRLLFPEIVVWTRDEPEQVFTALEGLLTQAACAFALDLLLFETAGRDPALVKVLEKAREVILEDTTDAPKKQQEKVVNRVRAIYSLASNRLVGSVIGEQVADFDALWYVYENSRDFSELYIRGRRKEGAIRVYTHLTNHLWNVTHAEPGMEKHEVYRQLILQNYISRLLPYLLLEAGI